MARVASFEYYEDPVGFTNPSVCGINWSAQTISFPGVASVAFAQCDELVAAINQLYTQDITDNVVDTQKTIVGGTSTLSVSYNHAATPPTMTIGAATSPASKIKDLADGIQLYVLDEITPAP